MSNGVRSLLIVVSSALLGVVYYRYLTANPFPPDYVRLVPVAWLALSIFGGVAAAGALRSDGKRIAAGVGLVLFLPSVILAFVFTIAALMGD